ncbi:hypothetical protein JOC33_003457 [Thalassobacillus pellis]|nr:hypothetical protein [Thalassobacillus pellis]
MTLHIQMEEGYLTKGMVEDFRVIRELVEDT